MTAIQIIGHSNQFKKKKVLMMKIRLLSQD